MTFARKVLLALNRPGITLETPMQFSIAVILTKLCGIAPDLAEVIGLWVKAKSKNSPGGKALTDEEKADLSAALQELVEDLKD